MSTRAPAQVTLREATPGDVEECARICFAAFGGLDDHHRFPRDFPVLEAALEIMDAWIGHPSIWGVVAEADGRVVGSNFLDERDPIAGVGPITVDPDFQDAGIGRRLMEAVMERGREAPGIRLLQDAFHMRSLSLYSSLGFDVKDPVVVAVGTPRGAPAPCVDARPMEEADLGQCEELSVAVHGYPRTNALRDALAMTTPWLALRDGRVVAYCAGTAFWPLNHGVAETPVDMAGLLLAAGAATGEPLALLVPLRGPLLDWCLRQGLRLVKPMNVMAAGDYREPRGAWFPSVIY